MQPKQSAFLTAYVITAGHISRAARLAKIARSRHYDWLSEPEYVTAFARAERQATDVLIDEMKRRAFEGVKKAIYFRGERCGYEQMYSDGMAMFLARGLDPDKWRDRQQIEHTGAGGEPIAITVTFVRP